MPPRGEHRQWLQEVLGVNTAGGSPPEHGEEGERVDSPSDRAQDPIADERHRREDSQRDRASESDGDRLADAAKDLLIHYASQHLGSLSERALQDLARAWRESPAGTIAAATIFGAAGVAYLAGTGANIPNLPPIPLDFLADRVPALRGAQLNIQVRGPITGPESFSIGVTFREQPANNSPTPTGRGRVFTPRMVIRQPGIRSAGPEVGAQLEIEGQIPIPSNASAPDVRATRAAIENGTAEVLIGGQPAMVVRILSVADNYRSGPYGLGQPPLNRALTVRLSTTLPPLFHQGPDEMSDRPVRVQINRVGSEGDVVVQVHMRPFPTPSRGGGNSANSETPQVLDPSRPSGAPESPASRRPVNVSRSLSAAQSDEPGINSGELSADQRVQAEAWNRAHVPNVVRFDRASQGRFAMRNGQLDAVRLAAWQAERGLPATGMADDATIAAAGGASSVSPRSRQSQQPPARRRPEADPANPESPIPYRKGESAPRLHQEPASIVPEAVAWGGVSHSFPSGPPSNVSSHSSFNLTNNHSVSGRVFCDHDVVVFEITNDHDDHVRIEVTLTDDEGNGVLDRATLELGEGDPVGYVQFSDFGVRADSTSPRTSCQYELQLTNVDAPRTGTQVGVRIYY